MRILDYAHRVRINAPICYDRNKIEIIPSAKQLRHCDFILAPEKTLAVRWHRLDLDVTRRGAPIFTHTQAENVVPCGHILSAVDKAAGREMNSEERNEYRARLVREVLGVDDAPEPTR